MYRGTTPTHQYRINIDPSVIKTIKITYVQNDAEILVKRTEDCTIVGNTVMVKLTQEETLMFNSDYFVKIQMRILTTDGSALASAPIITTVGICLDEEVLV